MIAKHRVFLLVVPAAIMIAAIGWEAQKSRALQRWSADAFGDGCKAALKIAILPALVTFFRRRSLPAAVRDCMKGPDAVALVVLDPGKELRVFDASHRPASPHGSPTFRGIAVLKLVNVSDPQSRLIIDRMVRHEISWQTEFRQCVNPRLLMRFTRGEAVAELLFGSDWECLMVFLNGHHVATCATERRDLNRIPLLLAREGVVLEEPPPALLATGKSRPI